jgi:hypothetical protein
MSGECGRRRGFMDPRGRQCPGGLLDDGMTEMLVDA